MMKSSLLVLLKAATAISALRLLNAEDVRTDTYQGCEFPEFEWAAYGTRLTGRMYTRRAALLGESLYAAGYLKSTNAPNNEGFVDVDDDFGVSGPYTRADPTGQNATSITSDLISYTTEYGSFAQYEVGVVKINRMTGEPQDVFVYYGEGQDETTGLAAKVIQSGDKVLAVSGHFVGSLAAEKSDGSKIEIFNSQADGGADYVQHPNAVKNGFDDGFVISADADTGNAKWLVRYPSSNKDSETVGVDIDSEGNVYGAGYRCNPSEEPDTVNEDGTTSTPEAICDGFVAKFSAIDGSIIWEQIYTDLGAAMWIVYDETDDALYFTGTTSYFGDEENSKMHISCEYDVCGVTARISAVDGSMHWVRTVEGSPRWNLFDQTGDIRLANDNDGPYIYVALDDAGENGRVSLDGGTSYSGCLSSDGVTFTPEYEVDQSVVVTADHCPEGSLFIPRDDVQSMSAAEAGTNAFCGIGDNAADTCVMKYHKFTGLPIWSTDVPPVASIVPSADGMSVMVVGFYYPTWGHFDSVVLPDYNGVEGAYNAKIDASTGLGEYVMNSGGTHKDRPYDAVGSPEGDVYIVGYTQSEVINWGGTLKTKIIEEGVDQNDDVGTAFQFGNVGGKTSEYQFFATKLASSVAAALPSCVASCSAEGTSSAIINAGTCFIDNVCYNAGDTAELFGRACLVCDPDKSQTEWVHGPTIGDSECFIDNVCRAQGDFYSYRASRRETYTSMCQVCDPSSDSFGWSVNADSGYVLIPDTEPPNDCVNSTLAPTRAPVQPVAPTTSAPVVGIKITPANKPTISPVDAPTNSPVDAPTNSPVDAPTNSPVDTVTGLGSSGDNVASSTWEYGVWRVSLIGLFYLSFLIF